MDQLHFVYSLMDNYYRERCEALLNIVDNLQQQLTAMRHRVTRYRDTNRMITNIHQEQQRIIRRLEERNTGLNLIIRSIFEDHPELASTYVTDLTADTEEEIIDSEEEELVDLLIP